MSDVKEETLSGLKWRSIESLSVKGIQFVIGLVMARLLLPSDYGAVAMLSVFFAFSKCFIDSGFNNALVRKLDRTETDFSTVFYFNVVVAVIMYGVLFLIAPWVGDFFNMPILCPILRVQAVELILNSFVTVQVARLTIAIDFKALAMRSATSSLISGGLGIALAYSGYGVWALVWQGIAATFVRVVFICAYCRWKPLWVFSWQSFRELFSYGGKLLLSRLINQIYAKSTTLIIGKFFSPEDLGFYSKSTSLARYPSTTIKDVLRSVTFPVLVKLQNDDAHLIRVYRKYISMSSMCIFFGCVLLAALARPLILFLLTDKWAASIIYLHIYCFGIMFDHLGGINLNLLQVKGRSDLYLRLEVFKKTLGMGILLAAVPFGVLGICISKVIWAQVALAVNTYYTGKLFGMGYWTQMRDWSGFFIKAVLACAPAYMITLLPIPHLAMILLGGGVSVLLYYIMVRPNESFKEAAAIFVEKIKKKQK